MALATKPSPELVNNQNNGFLMTGWHEFEFLCESHCYRCNIDLSINKSGFCCPVVAGRTAQLVAKYRPPMPIVTLVVPRLINDGIRWRLEGR
jgi:hypothetical protein